MIRQMIDCTSAAVRAVAVRFPNPEMIAWYGTGSTDIRWTDSDLAMFPHSVMVEIDQGFGNSPVPSATVRDVESGAWAPGHAVDLTGWTAERPTIYCDRSTLPSVIADGWRGDVWLAYPGYNAPTPPRYDGVNVVAVQSVLRPDYDMSIVYDTSWPLKAPVFNPTMSVSVTVHERVADAAWSRVVDASHYVIEYQASSMENAVLVMRVPQVDNTPVLHASPLHIPGARGGFIHFYAIVNGAAVNIGSRQLP